MIVDWALTQPLWPGQNPEEIREALPRLWADSVRDAGHSPAGEPTVVLLTVEPLIDGDPTEHAWRVVGPITVSPPTVRTRP